MKNFLKQNWFKLIVVILLAWVAFSLSKIADWSENNKDFIDVMINKEEKPLLDFGF